MIYKFGKSKYPYLNYYSHVYSYIFINFERFKCQWVNKLKFSHIKRLKCGIKKAKKSSIGPVKGGGCSESAQQTLQSAGCHLPSVELSFDSGTHEPPCCRVDRPLIARFIICSSAFSVQPGREHDRIHPCHLHGLDYKRVGGQPSCSLVESCQLMVMLSSWANGS